ncbi:MAG: hypothetical protein RJB09_959 [Pseudomonadota bacterium]
MTPPPPRSALTGVHLRRQDLRTGHKDQALRHTAAVEDVNHQRPRRRGACDWIAGCRNLRIAGASGPGTSWLACALGHRACRENMSVPDTRLPRLFADLAICHGDARYGRLLRSFARAKLLILDNWGQESAPPSRRAISSKSMRTATTRARSSSPARFPSTKGTTGSQSRPLPTPSSTASSTTRKRIGFNGESLLRRPNPPQRKRRQEGAYLT